MVRSLVDESDDSSLESFSSETEGRVIRSGHSLVNTFLYRHCRVEILADTSERGVYLILVLYLCSRKKRKRRKSKRPDRSLAHVYASRFIFTTFFAARSVVSFAAANVGSLPRRKDDRKPHPGGAMHKNGERTPSKLYVSARVCVCVYICARAT